MEKLINLINGLTLRENHNNYNSIEDEKGIIKTMSNELEEEIKIIHKYLENKSEVINEDKQLKYFTLTFNPIKIEFNFKELNELYVISPNNYFKILHYFKNKIFNVYKNYFFDFDEIMKGFHDISLCKNITLFYLSFEDEKIMKNYYSKYLSTLTQSSFTNPFKHENKAKKIFLNFQTSKNLSTNENLINLLSIEKLVNFLFDNFDEIINSNALILLRNSNFFLFKNLSVNRLFIIDNFASLYLQLCIPNKNNKNLDFYLSKIYENDLSHCNTELIVHLSSFDDNVFDCIFKYKIFMLIISDYKSGYGILLVLSLKIAYVFLHLDQNNDMLLYILQLI